MKREQNLNLAIWLTLLIAMIADIIVLPKQISAFRPDWVALATIYWTMAMPWQYGLFGAWAIGLLLDVLLGTWLGQHALALTLVAYITINFHLRLRSLPLWQQTIGVGLILIGYRLIMLWIDGVSGHPPHTWLYWLPIGIDIIIWPFIFWFLRLLRRRFQPLHHPQ